MGVAQALSYTFVMVCIMTFIYEMGSAGIDNGECVAVCVLWVLLHAVVMQSIFGPYSVPKRLRPAEWPQLDSRSELAEKAVAPYGLATQID